MVARAAIDHNGFFGPQTLRGARGVESGVAAAVNQHAAAEPDGLGTFGGAQQGQRIEDAFGVAGRDVSALGDLRADGEIDGVIVAGSYFGDGIVKLVAIRKR